MEGDRRFFLVGASIVTACSASAVMFVQEGNSEHMLMYITKVVEGIASSFIMPCLAALTLACFGPLHFDAVMASNIFWGHIGTSIAAVLAGISAYALYPNIKFCFLVIGASALLAVFFTQFLPQGDQMLGRGFQGKSAMNEEGHMVKTGNIIGGACSGPEKEEDTAVNNNEASTYMEVLTDKKTLILCLTGFFFQ